MRGGLERSNSCSVEHHAKIVIIRMVEMVGEGILPTFVRDGFPQGAVIEMTKIENLINAIPASRHRCNTSDDLYSLLTVPTLSLFRAGYSPLLLLGAISMEGLDVLRSSLAGKNVASVSLYLTDRSLLLQHRQMHSRRLRTALSPPDLLTKLRANRALSRLELDVVRARNSEIYATRDCTDWSFDVSNLDAQSILSLLAQLIENRE